MGVPVEGFNGVEYVKKAVRHARTNLEQRYDHFKRLEYLIIGISDETVLTSEDGEGLETEDSCETDVSINLLPFFLDVRCRVCHMRSLFA